MQNIKKIYTIEDNRHRMLSVSTLGLGFHLIDNAYYLDVIVWHAILHSWEVPLLGILLLNCRGDQNALKDHVLLSSHSYLLSELKKKCTSSLRRTYP